jgi:hypothetical protein
VKDVVELDAERVRLRDDLGGAAHVAETAEAVFGGAARDHVRVATVGTKTFGERGEVSLVADLTLHRVVVEGRADHVAQKQVPHTPVLGSCRRGPVVVHEHAPEPHSCSRRAGLASVIRLHGSHCDERVRTDLEGIADDELELPSLVAAAGQPGEVIALDPNLGPTDVIRQAAERVDRCREARQLHPRIARESVDKFGGVDDRQVGDLYRRWPAHS